MFFQADGEIICVLARGDHEVNDVKVQRVHPCLSLEMAEEADVEKLVGCTFGSLGPVGLNNVKIYADLAVEQMVNLVCGANEEAYHFVNVNPGRDFQVTGYYDLRMLKEGEAAQNAEKFVSLLVVLKLVKFSNWVPNTVKHWAQPIWMKTVRSKLFIWVVMV